MKLTYDDFVLFPDDGLRHELIDREHYAAPSPNTKHQRISINLTVPVGGLTNLTNSEQVRRMRSWPRS